MTREENLLYSMVGAGLDSVLAQKARQLGFTLTTLKQASKAKLRASFAPDEVETILQIRRKPIPIETVQRLVDECDWKCCLCWDWDRDDPVIIHHIEAHADTADDDYENLVLLCSTHHDKAHYRSDLARPPFPPALIRKRKETWVRRIALYRSGIGAKPGHEPPSFPASVSPTAPPTDFVGRTEELEEIERCIREGKAAVLHGMGGIGKSALAALVAARASPPRATLAGDLGQVAGSAPAILRSWARACGTETGGLPEQELVNVTRSALASRAASSEPLLLLVDDVRAEWVAAGQMLRQVVPADVPALFTGHDATLAGSLNAHPVHLGELSGPEGVGLLRALAGGSFEEDAPADDLVAALGGLPLALELAGRRLAVDARRPGPAVARLLAAVREGASRALAFPGRRGLSAVFSVTYNAHPERLRSLFRLVGVFASTTFEYRDLEAIACEVGRDSHEDDLQTLIEAALLEWTDVPGRYRVHPLLHQHAAGLLDKAGERESAAAAHAERFREFVETHEEPDTDGLDRIEHRLPEILAALRFLLQQGSPDALTLMQSLWVGGVFQMRGNLSGVEELLSEAIGLARLMSEEEQESQLLGHLGSLYAMTGRTMMAVDLLGRAATLSARLGLTGDEAAHRGNLGIAFSDLGRIREAACSHQRALDLALAAKRVDVTVDQMSHLAAIARQGSRGRTGPDADRAREEAIQLYRGALEILDMLDSDEASMRSRRGAHLSNMGLVYEDLGQYEQAEEHVRQGLEIAKQEGDLRGIANRTGHLANLAFLQGRYAEAIPLYREAARLAEQASAPRLQATWLYNLGFFRVSAHAEKVPSYSMDDALATLQEAWTVAEGIDYIEMMGQVMYAVAWLHYYEDRPGHAGLAMANAAELLEEVGSPMASMARKVLAGEPPPDEPPQDGGR